MAVKHSLPQSSLPPDSSSGSFPIAHSARQITLAATKKMASHLRCCAAWRYMLSPVTVRVFPPGFKKPIFCRTDTCRPDERLRVVIPPDDDPATWSTNAKIRLLAGQCQFFGRRSLRNTEPTHCDCLRRRLNGACFRSGAPGSCRGRPNGRMHRSKPWP
jgi:hypothetical protein